MYDSWMMVVLLGGIGLVLN